MKKVVSLIIVRQKMMTLDKLLAEDVTGTSTRYLIRDILTHLIDVVEVIENRSLINKYDIDAREEPLGEKI